MSRRKPSRKRKRKRKRSRQREVLASSAPHETSVDVEGPDALTPDQFRELRDEFFAGIPARLEILKAEVVEAMAEFDAFDVIANLLLANLPFDVESYRESEHEGLIALVEYAGLLLLERPSRDGGDPDRLRPMGAGEIRPLLDRLREMLALSSFLGAEEVTHRREETRALDHLRVRIVHREIFLRNPTYDWQETANLRSLFGSKVASADLRAAVGFDVDDALAFVEAVWRMGLDRFWERGQISREIAKTLEDDVRRFIRGEAPEHEDFSDLATAIAGEPASARKALVRNLAIGYAWTRAGDAMQLTADDLAAAAGRALDAAGAFLDFFSITFGAVAGTTAFSGSHLLRTRPVIRDADGHYMCTYYGNILYALRSRLEEQLKPRGGEAGSTQRWERYNRARRTFAEERAVSLLRAGLKTETAWVNPRYSIDGGDLVELDGLVLVDTVLFVLEAKGSALSPPARRALPPRLKRDVEEVLAVAALQAGRLTSAIEDRRTLTFVDSEGYALPLDTNALSRAFPIVVTLDDFSGLSTSLWSLAEAELLNAPQPLPWIVSLDELEIVLDLLDYASQLPHFLMRRRLINESKAVRASDELDFFVFYLLRGLYFEDVLAEEDGPDHIFLQSMTDDVDAYYLWKQGHRKSKARKPSMKFDPLTRKFMGQLDTERPPGFVEASIALLEMSGETRAQFSRHTRRLVAQSARDGSFHDFTLSFVPDSGWGVTVVTAPRTRPDDVPTRLTPHVVLKKHQLGADIWIGFGVVAGAKKTFQALVVDYTPWRPDAELDEGVAQFFRDLPPVDQLSAKKRQALERETC